MKFKVACGLQRNKVLLLLSLRHSENSTKPCKDERKVGQQKATYFHAANFINSVRYLEGRDRHLFNRIN